MIEQSPRQLDCMVIVWWHSWLLDRRSVYRIVGDRECSDQTVGLFDRQLIWWSTERTMDSSFCREFADRVVGRLTGWVGGPLTVKVKSRI